MNQDTIHPYGILNALKLAIGGFVANFAMLFSLNERAKAGAGGEGGEGGEGDGDGEGDTNNNNAGAGGSDDWRETLPAEIKAHPVLQKYKTNVDAIKGLVDAQKLIGKEKIPLPGKDATDEDWAEVWNRLGRPETVDGYKLPEDVKLAEGMSLDAGMIKGFKEQCHKHGILPKQAESIYRWFVESQNSAFNGFMGSRAEITKKAETAMRNEYGQAYEQNIALAQKVVKKFAGEEAFKALAAGAGNDPHLIRMFVNIGKAMSEDQLGGKAKSFIMEPAEAQAEIAKIKADLKHPLWVEGHPEHKMAVDKWNQLHALAHPETTPA